MFESLLSTGQIDNGYDVIFTPLATLPVAVSHITVATDSKKIWAIGGQNNSAVLINGFYEYDIDSNNWQSLQNLPIITRGGALAVNEGCAVYAGGGGAAGANMNNRIYQYNRSTNTWAQSETFPVGGELGYAQVGPDGLHVIGGYDGTSMVNRHFKFNLDNSGYVNRTGLAITNDVRIPGCRWDGGDYIYLLGGNSANGAVRVSTFKRYQISTDTWEILPNAPVTGHSFCLIILDNRVYAYSPNNNDIYSNRLFEYHIFARQWTEKKNLPTLPVHGICGSTQVNNELYLISGYTGTTRINSVSKLTWVKK